MVTPRINMGPGKDTYPCLGKTVSLGAKGKVKSRESVSLGPVFKDEKG